MKNRLLIFTTEFPPVIGGISSYCYELAKAILGEGLEVFVITDKPRGLLCHHKTKEGFLVITIPNYPIFLRIVSALWLIYILHPSHIILNGARYIFLFGLIKPIVFKRHSIVLYGDDVRYMAKAKSLKKVIYKRAFNKSLNIITVSNFTKNLLSTRMNISPQRIDVIYPTVPQEILENKFKIDEVSRLRKNLGLSSNSLIILTISRLTSRKGHDVILTSISRLLKDYPNLNLRYIIVGDGPIRERLKLLTYSLGLENVVQFVGKMPFGEDKPFYALCDIFVMMSREESNIEDGIEGFGISFIEASACYKPVIGGRHGGVTEAIVDNETGFVILPEDVERLTDAMRRLVMDEKLRINMGIKGRKRVEAMFTNQIMVKSFLDLIFK